MILSRVIFCRLARHVCLNVKNKINKFPKDHDDSYDHVSLEIKFYDKIRNYVDRIYIFGYSPYTTMDVYKAEKGEMLTLENKNIMVCCYVIYGFEEEGKKGKL